MEKKITHKQLVTRASLWLRNNQNYTVIFTELTTCAGEVPDVIGFHCDGGSSVLVECKVSRSDFLNDKKKFFRHYPTMGMGNKRFMCAPKDMIKPEELPKGWGLLEATAKRIKVIVRSGFHEADANKEKILLISILRRLELAATVFVRS